MSEQDSAFEQFIRVYGKSEVVFEEGSSGKEMYIVCSGKVKLYVGTGNGKRRLLAVLGPGEHFGEMNLVDKSPRSATAIAAQDNTVLAALDRIRFIYLVRQQPRFALTLMETMSKRIREANLLVSGGAARSQSEAEVPAGSHR